MGEKELPSNVARFEQLMYLALVIGFFNSALTWNYDVVDASKMGGASFVLFLMFAFAFMALFIWLIARRRKNWACWVMLVLFVLGLPPYIYELHRMLHFVPVTGALGLAQTLVEAVAYSLIFSGNARDWFQRTPTPVQA